MELLVVHHVQTFLHGKCSIDTPPPAKLLKPRPPLSVSIIHFTMWPQYVLCTYCNFFWKTPPLLLIESTFSALAHNGVLLWRKAACTNFNLQQTVTTETDMCLTWRVSLLLYFITTRIAGKAV